MQYNIDYMKQKVQKHLDQIRYEHTMGVMYTAAAMAMRYGVDLEKATVAGLLHDCAKCIPSKEKLEMCEKHVIPVSDAERKNPGLLHAKLGAFLARTKYGVEDEEILDSITFHTTGRPEMTLLDKIVYIADYLEPNRKEAPNLDKVRALAFTDIDACLYVILEDSLAYLHTKKEVIDPMTEQTYLYYKKEWKEQCSWNNQS